MLNEEELEILWAELEQPQYADELAAKDYESLTAQLNAHTTIANPTPQPSRPKLITWVAFLDAHTNADTLKLYGYGALATDMRRALDANDRTSMTAIWKGLKTVLSAQSITAVEALAQATELDPAWPATIAQPSIAQGLGLGTVGVEDVATACHRYGGM